MITPSIIFENSSLLAIAKPPGWVVNDAITVKDTPTIQGWIAKNFSFQTAKNNNLRNGIVHRLDKETSGVLLIAKTSDSFEYLQSLFKKREIKKEYTALVHGKMPQKKGTITASVGRLPWNKKRFGVSPGGRDAETTYEVSGQFSKKDDSNQFYSLLKLTPKTGRTHQIRIHLKHLGNPIVADNFYAGRKTSRKDRLWVPRLFLHASSIDFKGSNGKKIQISSNLPKDLAIALKLLKPLE